MCAETMRWNGKGDDCVRSWSWRHGRLGWMMVVSMRCRNADRPRGDLRHRRGIDRLEASARAGNKSGGGSESQRACFRSDGGCGAFRNPGCDGAFTVLPASTRLSLCDRRALPAVPPEGGEVSGGRVRPEARPRETARRRVTTPQTRSLLGVERASILAERTRSPVVR